MSFVSNVMEELACKLAGALIIYTQNRKTISIVMHEDFAEYSLYLTGVGAAPSIELVRDEKLFRSFEFWS